MKTTIKFVECDSGNLSDISKAKQISCESQPQQCNRTVQIQLYASPAKTTRFGKKHPQNCIYALLQLKAEVICGRTHCLYLKH